MTTGREQPFEEHDDAQISLVPVPCQWVWLCEQCGWSTRGSKPSALSKRILRHAEGCRLCVAHGHQPGSNVIAGCTCRECQKARKEAA